MAARGFDPVDSLPFVRSGRLDIAEFGRRVDVHFLSGSTKWTSSRQNHTLKRDERTLARAKRRGW